MKRYLFFISCGRCGTTRIAEILRKALPSEKYAVVHQMKYSRIANVIGNLMYYFGESERIKELLYFKIINRNRNDRHLISTDPLTAMIIPKCLTNNPANFIIHIQRKHDVFAESMYSFSHSRFKSFVAHNFVPFWQIGVLPLENAFNKNIKKKYKNVSIVKNHIFWNKYKNQKNYLIINMNELFSSNFIQNFIRLIFDENIVILDEDLKHKSNESNQQRKHLKMEWI